MFYQQTAAPVEEKAKVWVVVEAKAAGLVDTAEGGVTGREWQAVTE